MIIYVDIDGTVCHTENSDYENSIPRYNQIEKINKFFDDGHEVVYWTARGGTTDTDWSELTEEQLNNWGCKYTKIETQKKPSWDLFIDDKTKRIEEV
jgi:hypothetical protein